MIRLKDLQEFKLRGEKFSCLTCYEATFASVMQAAEIEVILVGDSLGMVVQGQSSTVPVTVADMAYHTRAVARGNTHALIMADLPFMSYATLEQCLTSSRELMQAGAHMVKLEGGLELAPMIKSLKSAGTPVCAHLGLTPQSVNVMSGYKVQGRGDTAGKQLIDAALELVQAGAALLLVECIPAELAAELTQKSSVPVIGIGAGAATDAQVLVMHDMLGVNLGRPAKFVKNFMLEADSIEGAFVAYRQAVNGGHFPGSEHTFSA